MGSWTITVSGHGVHDNDLPEDVDNRVAEFIDRLRADGHAVDHATLTVGAGRAYVRGEDGLRVQTF